MVHSEDLPVFGTRCRWPGRSTACAVSIRLSDQVVGALRSPVAAKGCRLTTERPSGPRASPVRAGPSPRWRAELACDWHTVNDAVVTDGEALLDLRPTAGDWGTEAGTRG